MAALHKAPAEHVVDEGRILGALNRSLADRLGLGAFVVGVVYSLLIPLHLWSHPDHGERIAWTAAVSAAGLFSLAAWWRRNPPAPELAQGRIALLLGVVLANDAVFHWTIGSPYQTIGLCVELLCAALFLTSRAWFVTIVAATWGVFVVMLWRHGPSPEFTPPLILLLSATAIAVILQLTRTLQLRRIAAARIAAADARTRLALTRADRDESEERYRLLAENAFDLIVELDDVRRITYVNPRVSELLGYPARAFIGSLAREWTPRLADGEDWARLSELVRLPIDRGETAHVTTRVRRSDGDWRWVEFTMRPFRTHHGERRFVLIGRDVTQQRETQEELEARVEERTARLEQARRDLEKLNQSLKDVQSQRIRAEQLGAAEGLAGSVAHAINNPLAALLGHLELARDREPGNPTVERALRLASRIRDVVKHTLTLYREGDLQLERVALDRLLGELAADLERTCRARGIALELKVQSELPQVRADAALLTAALAGLAQNALDAMPDGGTLTLEASLSPSNGTVALVVSDTGPGIPEELREKVLEPFFTTKPGGTGLGLAIAESVARGHRGRLQIGARPGGGASVALQLLVPDGSDA